MVENQTFRRSQIFWTLWQTFARFKGTSIGESEVPAYFKARVVKMLDLGVPHSDADRPGKSGIFAEFDEYHCFELALALAIQNSGGLKQAEVAYILGRWRHQIRWEHLALRQTGKLDVLEGIIVERERGLAGSTWEFPVFMVFQFIALEEARPMQTVLDAHLYKGKGLPPFVSDPAFCYGMASLHENLERNQFSLEYTVRCVVELSVLAARVAVYLRQAPANRRGRR